MSKPTTTRGQSDTAAGNDPTAQLLSALGRLVTPRGQDAREPGTVYDAAHDRWQCLYCHYATANGQPFEHAKDCPILVGRALLATLAAQPLRQEDPYTRRLLGAARHLRARQALDLQTLKDALALIDAALQPEGEAADEGR